jgi:hypothetical protein
MGGQNFIYVVTPEGQNRPCKIGFSGDPQQRAKNMSTGSPVRLSVRHVSPVDGPNPRWGSSRPYWECDRFARKVEAIAHRNLGSRRKRSEWFDVPLSEAVEAVQNAVKELRFAA